MTKNRKSKGVAGVTPLGQAAAPPSARAAPSLPSPEQPPARPELLSSEQTTSALSSPEYWRLLCPQLHVQVGEREAKPALQ